MTANAMRRSWPIVAVTAAARRTWRDPGALVVAAAFYAIVSSVVATLWRTAAQHAPSHQLGGYSGLQFTWYLATSEAAIIALNVRLTEQIGDDIGRGDIAAEMLRPASVLWLRVASEFGRCLPRLAVCCGTGIALSSAVAGGPPDASSLLLTAPALVLAVLCNLVAQHAFAAASFWLRDARTTWFLYQKFVFVLGGMLLPLQLLPGWLHTAANFLPFAAMAYVPARIASGHFEPALLALQVAWIAVLAVLAQLVFTAGERRLQIVGG